MAPHPLWRGLGCFRRARALAYGIGVGITVIGCQQDEPHQGFDPSSTPQVTIIPDSARPLQSAALVATTLLAESFDNAAVGARGWYDNTAPSISTTQKHGGGGALQWSYAKGATKPANGGAMRRKFTPTDRVYARFWVRYNETWVGSARAYHPHELQFVTTEDDDYVGPASTRLTAYVEHNYQNGGIPRVHLTDSRNIDVARVRQDLTRGYRAASDRGVQR